MVAGFSVARTGRRTHGVQGDISDRDPRTVAHVGTGRGDIDDVLARLTPQVVEVLGLEGDGVALSDHADELGFVTAPNERLDTIKARQFIAREGPCPDAFHSGEVVTSAPPSCDPRPTVTTSASKAASPPRRSPPLP